MAPFTAKYSDEQKEAVVSAQLDRGNYAPRTAELAAAGELTRPDGTKLDPFQISPDYAAQLKRAAQKRRQGRVESPLLKDGPADAVDKLLERAINGADALLQDYEKQLKKQPGQADPKRLSQILTVIREAAHLAKPPDTRPPKPGQKINGQRQSGAARSATATSILSELRQPETGAQAEPVAGHPSNPAHATRDTEHAQQPSAHDAAHTPSMAEPIGQPGSRIAGLDTRTATL